MLVFFYVNYFLLIPPHLFQEKTPWLLVFCSDGIYAHHIDFTLEGCAEQQTIAPLILITFIENAFKYGINPDEDSPVRIHICITANRLQLKVCMQWRAIM